MTPKKILLLSVSAGAGHARAAEALRVAAEAQGAVSTHLDAMDFVPDGFRTLYTEWYLSLVNRQPALWGYLYEKTNRADPASLSQRLRRKIERLNTRALVRAIAESKADAIVCTHFLPAELLSTLTARGEFATPVWVQVTDFDLHRLWVHPNMAGYFAGNDEIAFRLHAAGISPQTIHVTGIPIMPAFGAAPDREACANQLGLDAAKPTVLLMGGGAGIGRLDEVAARLMRIETPFQLVVLAGKNQEALARLHAMPEAKSGRLFPLVFTPHVERAMAVSDVAITKPGGLSTSECLAMGLPMILNSPIPGQEERNADFLLEQGAALKASDAVTLEYRLRNLLSAAATLGTMRENARRIARPHAARDAIQKVLRALD
jgi:processive 1,2-diacylglycerol beta-glucosyltransferase